MKKILSYLFFFLFACQFYAQIPTLEIKENNNHKKSTDVILQNLSYDIKITGNISTTVATLVFRNNSSKILEGRLTFPLPENVSVSGYALDINGKLRNAVSVEKEKAKEVFETIQKQRVDPGIIEKVEGNNFRTRIYPINPNSERTVQITYNMELKKNEQNLTYFLPLKLENKIQDFKLHISVFEKANAPKLVEKPDGNFDFVKNGNVWNATIDKKDFQPINDLKINIPISENSQQTILQKATGNSAYFLSNVNISGKEILKKKPSEIAIVWDNSLSGMNRNHEKEFKLLEEYFKVLKNVSVKVYFLNNQFEEEKKFQINNTNYAGIPNWEPLKKYLSETVYDGGTDFGTIKPISADEILFFSDGISSFGDLDLKWKVPVYTIVASSKANFSQMKFIAIKTGGEFLNLNENEISKEVKKLSSQSFKFLGFKDNTDVSEVYPSLPTTVNENFSVSGILNKNNTTLTLLFGYGNKPTIEKKIEINAENQINNDWDISKFWAQNKVAELEIFNDKNKEEIKNLGKQFGIVTNNSSLMVLENIDDYVKYQILPPAELRAEYDKIIKENREEKAEYVNDLLKDAESMIEELKEWHKKDFAKKKIYPKPRKGDLPPPPPVDDAGSFGTAQTVGSVQSEVSRPQIVSDSATKTRDIDNVVIRGISSLPQNAIINETLSGSVAGINIKRDSAVTKDIESVVVTSIRKGKITIVDVKSDKEYMKSFEGKNAAQIYREYLKQRTNYITTPSFYFDISQLLFSKNDKILGLKVLSSIADLDLENEELYKLLAYKLKQAEANDKQLWISKKVLKWRPFDPQSYRDYALAAEDNGKSQEALDHLYKILTQSYTQEIADRDEGIEETVLMEINSLISKHRSKLNLSKINPKLIAHLPVNIRVVINWNKDDTDIDLWVTDPNGEKCDYSHNDTEIGGKMSDDFTGGFGPEQFLLKKAIKGKYKIETNFFGENQATLTGPTAILAEIYLNYATGKQERKLVVFQNQKTSEEGNGDGILIGEFEF